MPKYYIHTYQNNFPLLNGNYSDVDHPMWEDHMELDCLLFILLMRVDDLLLL